jgi:hypothetical protein
MWNAKQWAGSALAALALAAAGCADNGRGVTSPDLAKGAADAGDDDARVYDQVDYLGNPLVSEVTIVKARHDAYNRTMPYAPAAFKQETENFITGVAGRSPQYASVVAGVLYAQSDLLIVDTSKPASTAGWLTWALGSPYGSGNAGWGGRKLADDVVDVGLYAIFSSFLPLDREHASCAPGELPLCTDNVDANDKPFLTTFPYLAPPTL